MRKLFLFFLLLPIGTHFAQAQLLWEISHPTLKEKSYLFGTMHVSDERVFQFSPKVMPAFKQADTFAGEVKISEDVMFRVLEFIFMPADTTLAMLLDSADNDFIQQKLNKKLGMAAPFTNRMMPIFISMLMADAELIDSDRPPLDLYLQEEAEKAGKSVIGLETIEEQLSLFTEIPLKEQARQLLKELKEQQTSNTQGTEELILLYTSQDTDSLYKIVTEGMDETTNQKMLIERNQRMLERSIMLLERGQSVFIAIGAAHLPGPDGLVRLLKKKGYRLEPFF